MGITLEVPQDSQDNSESNPMIKYIVIGVLVVAVIVFMVATSTKSKKEEKE